MVSMHEGWIQEMRDESVIETTKILTKFNLADIMTKPMAAKGFKFVLKLFEEMQAANLVLAAVEEEVLVLVAAVAAAEVDQP